MCLRAGFKLILFFLTCLFYFLISGFCLLLKRLDPKLYRKVVAEVIHRFCSFAVKFMGLEVRIKGNVPKGARLIVANHLSYLDVLILSCYLRASFVTSVEVKRTPFLGQICQLAGCLFVERRSRDNLSQEIAEITKALQQGTQVMIFPEATSTNGESVLRFKKPLFQASLEANVPVLPISINYQTINGQKINLKTRDQVFWYGDMTFLSHLWNFLKLKQVVVELKLYQEILWEKTTPEELALISQRRVQEAFQPILV